MTSSRVVFVGTLVMLTLWLYRNYRYDSAERPPRSFRLAAIGIAVTVISVTTFFYFFRR